jgi:DNA topoisomerase-2
MAKMNIKDFFGSAVRDYSIYACERAIPSGVDGLKPSQRKVLYGMTKEFPTQEVKVSICAATIQAVTAYHHGSLEAVVTGMAQNFVGSNNVPLLEGIGQFGSRITPIPAASRYIFAKLSQQAKQLFRPVDDNILEWLDDDGLKIEPKFYLPVLPLVLINGAEGMGTGFSTYIMGYKPDDLKKRTLEILNGSKKKTSLTPWYRGFNGTISKNLEGQTVTAGKLEVVNTTTIKITELPIGVFTMKYRDHLNAMEDKDLIKSYDDNSNEQKIEFIVKVSREFSAKSEEELIKAFKLQNRNSETITVWDEKGKIRRFDTAEDLLEWFVVYRLTRYEDRRLYMISAAEERVKKMTEQMRFIRLYLKRSSVWSKTKTDLIRQELIDELFEAIDELLAIRVSRLTGDAIEELEQKIKNELDLIAGLNNTTAKDLYIEDLNSLKL